MTIVEARGLVKEFPRGARVGRRGGVLRAVDDVSFSIGRGRTLALVGESGCGKTTVGRMLLRLTDATAGLVRFGDVDVTALSGKRLRAMRPRMQMAFQDPMASLDPRWRVAEIVAEPLRAAERHAASEIEARVVEGLARVGLAGLGDRRPHELSGGQRQRVGLARALASEPEFVVLDEPTSALDVSVQAQILQLLRRLRREMGLTMLLISHDLAVVRHLCDDVAVMYLGRVVEQGPVDRVFGNPQHPYTQALLAAVPVPDPARRSERAALLGDVPSALSPPPGCRFHPRCPRARLDVCARRDPALEAHEPGQLAACHFPGSASRWEATRRDGPASGP